MTPELIDQVAASGDEETLTTLNTLYEIAQTTGAIICVDETLGSQMKLIADYADGMTMAELRAQEAAMAEMLPGFAFGLSLIHI